MRELRPHPLQGIKKSETEEATNGRKKEKKKKDGNKSKNKLMGLHQTKSFCTANDTINNKKANCSMTEYIHK